MDGMVNGIEEDFKKMEGRQDRKKEMNERQKKLKSSGVLFKELMIKKVKKRKWNRQKNICWMKKMN